MPYCRRSASHQSLPSAVHRQSASRLARADGSHPQTRGSSSPALFQAALVPVQSRNRMSPAGRHYNASESHHPLLTERVRAMRSENTFPYLPAGSGRPPLQASEGSLQRIRRHDHLRSSEDGGSPTKDSRRLAAQNSDIPQPADTSPETLRKKDLPTAARSHTSQTRQRSQLPVRHGLLMF